MGREMPPAPLAEVGTRCPLMHVNTMLPPAAIGSRNVFVKDTPVYFKRNICFIPLHDLRTNPFNFSNRDPQ